ncbi:MAG: biotin/lipoyl-binding protein [Firmicutes bacterium]|nr:biotin/lipoyl-binding protein [Bacillota bacterium]
MKKFKVTVEGKEYLVQVEEVNAEATSAPKQNQPQMAVKPANPSPAKTVLPATNPTVKSTSPEKPASTSSPSATGDYIVKAPMPGSVLDVKVAAGDHAADGDVLLILEAMKMENELTAPQAGTVKEVLVKKGDTVNSGDPLIILS